MGNKQSLRKECGYRVLQVKEGSPLHEQLDPYFDYIIDMTCQPSPKEILQKLTDKPARDAFDKPFLSRLKEQEGRKVVLKIFSGKDCSLNEVEFVPSSAWSENKQDLIGIVFRLERYQDVQDNYCRVTHIRPNSPVAQAAIKQGEYLIGVQEFKYENIPELTDKLYERLYDQEVVDKTVHFAIYNILNDQLRLVSIELKRKWGGDGLLGCELSQGHLYKFPRDIQKYRQGIKQEEKKKQEIIAARKEMSNSDGAGRLLAESLRRRTNNSQKRKLIIRNPERLAELKEQLNRSPISEQEASNLHPESDLEQRVWRLEQGMAAIQQALFEQQAEESKM